MANEENPYTFGSKSHIALSKLKEAGRAWVDAIETYERRMKERYGAGDIVNEMAKRLETDDSPEALKAWRDAVIRERVIDAQEHGYSAKSEAEGALETAKSRLMAAIMEDIGWIQQENGCRWVPKDLDR